VSRESLEAVSLLDIAKEGKKRRGEAEGAPSNTNHFLAARAARPSLL